jgi:hypothetical protein
MLAKFFHRSEPVSFIVMMVWIAILVFVHIANTNAKGVDIHYFIYSFGVLILYIGLMFYFDFLIQRYKLSSNNYYAHFFLLVLIGVFSNVLEINKYIISFGFILLSTGNVLNLRNKVFPNAKLFNSGFFLGIAYLIYPVSFLYLVLVYIGYFLYVKIIDKKLIIPLLGFIIPIFLTFTYFYFTNQTSIFKNWTEINISSGFHWTEDKKISLSIIGFALISIFLVLKYISIGSFSELKEERNYKMLITFLFITIVSIFLNSSQIKHQILWTFFPAVFLIGNTVQKIKREWLKEGIFYLSLIGSIIVFVL